MYLYHMCEISGLVNHARRDSTCLELQLARKICLYMSATCDI